MVKIRGINIESTDELDNLLGPANKTLKAESSEQNKTVESLRSLRGKLSLPPPLRLLTNPMFPEVVSGREGELSGSGL